VPTIRITTDIPPASPTPARPRRYIRELAPSERISGTFSIANAQLGRTKQDKPFLKCLIGDRTGQLPARMWSIEPAQFRRLPTDGFVYIEAETQPYQGELQLIIQSIDPVEPTVDQLRELLPCSARDPEEMFAEVRALLDTLQHPAARALAKAYLDDTILMDAFKRCPAAKSMHHAYIGGLLEHTLSLLNLADRVCPLYPKINRDVVMLGVFLHDLGKTRELVYDRTFSYSDRGELVGHVVDGAIMLHDKAQTVMRTQGVRLPQNFVMVLQHIILSHHSLPEYGAAKIPASPEAILVALLDNLDAKTFIALNAARPDLAAGAEGELGGNFTERQWALDTKLFRPDPLA
jgi:3'-5' exoribonuclease